MDKNSLPLTTKNIKSSTTNKEWFVREVKKGLKAAVEGRLIDHNNLKAKWEAKRTIF